MGEADFLLAFQHVQQPLLRLYCQHPGLAKHGHLKVDQLFGFCILSEAPSPPGLWGMSLKDVLPALLLKEETVGNDLWIGLLWG